MSDETPRAVDFARFQDHVLVIDLAALKRIEKRLRLELADPKIVIWGATRDFLTGALEGSVGLTELTVFLEEALRATQPTITEAEVLAMLAPKPDQVNAATSATLAVAAAIVANFPEAKKGATEAPGAGPLPGSTSGAPAAPPASPNGSSGG